MRTVVQTPASEVTGESPRFEAILRTATVVQLVLEFRISAIWKSNPGKGANGERTYRIVGVDEADPDRGWVS